MTPLRFYDGSLEPPPVVLYRNARLRQVLQNQGQTFWLSSEADNRHRRAYLFFIRKLKARAEKRHLPIESVLRMRIIAKLERAGFLAELSGSYLLSAAIALVTYISYCDISET